MWNAFKKGFGFMLGIGTASVVIDIASTSIKNQSEDSQEYTEKTVETSK